MTKKKWGVPVIVCGPHYEPVVYPHDRIANVRAECCGLSAYDAAREGCEAYRDRLAPCMGPDDAGCYWDEEGYPSTEHWLSEQAARDCNDERCPLKATLPVHR